MRKLGEDVSEMLEYAPASFFVIRHVRPKLTCTKCDHIVQAAAPSRPIERGIAGRGLLAHVLVSKYADHLPLYRQAEMYARRDIELERSTLADWVGGTSQLLEPLIEVLRRYVTASGKLHAGVQRSAPSTTVSYVAATPKPRLVHLDIIPQRQESFSIGSYRHKAILMS